MTDERQAYLDENFPLIEQGVEPPGRAVPDERPGSRALIWKGSSGWRTRHGESVIYWMHGRPWEVIGALLPDGSRGPVRSMLDHGLRRQSSSRQRRWTYGTIDVRPEDVVFMDSPTQPTYAPPPERPGANLERDLALDQVFLEALRDDRFAQAVYSVFMNRDFVRASDLALWSSGDRQAARLVAGLRRLGESYQDYFLDYDFDGQWLWPDDRPRREAELKKMIQMTEGMQAASTNAKYAANIASLRERLAKLDDPSNADVMIALRGHLARLGWRTKNEDDERRLGAEAMRSGLQLLDVIESLETLPQGQPGAWWPGMPRWSGMLTARFVRDDLSSDEKAVWYGLRRRIDGLAESGRIDEDKYREMIDANAEVEARIGAFVAQ